VKPKNSLHLSSISDIIPDAAGSGDVDEDLGILHGKNIEISDWAL
jgi:hypothetical protein